MRIVITGVSGFVGAQLVPLLADAGHELLLVGRSPTRLEQRFPGKAACAYQDLPKRAKGSDLVVHLAVVNTDAEVPSRLFWEVNVNLALETAKAARETGIPTFVNISSVHALDQNRCSAYAETKREAAQRLTEIDGITVLNVYLPAVYGDRWSGKLSVLNNLPPPFGRMVFGALAALRPTVHVARLVPFLDAADRHVSSDEIILSDDQSDNRTYVFTKRALDVSFSIVIALLFWWALILVWLAIKLTSPGPGIFAQRRIGLNGSEFTCYKFRTMRQGTTQAGTHEVSEQAVTRIGRFLRRTKLDELPQIWNILRNEISLIGPRPCLPSQTELIEARRRRGVLKIKPGISGLAQINGIDMSKPEVLASWDARYMALRSIPLDVKILLATARGKGNGDRVKQREAEKA